MSCVPVCCGFVVCAITGPTNTGKSMLAADVLRQVGGQGWKNHRFSIKILWESIDFVPGQSRDGFGTILPSTSVRGVALATRNKAVCQAVWPAWHALTPRVEIGSMPASENVENPMYCHTFHYF